MGNAICSIAGCEAKTLAYGWCMKHHGRWRRTGSPLGAPILTREERFWAKVRVTPDCWVWTGAVAKGYGRFCVKTKTVVQAHRFSYELAHGAVPDDMFLDHICYLRTCVNPSHLRPVTHKQNMENVPDLRAHNTSGYMGVSLHRETGKWRASVGHNGERIRLGSFDSPEAANAAAAALRLRLFTHNDRDRRSA